MGAAALRRVFAVQLLLATMASLALSSCEKDLEQEPTPSATGSSTLRSVGATTPVPPPLTPGTEPSPSPAPASPSLSSPQPASNTAKGCLFTVPEVSQVLGGVWTRQPHQQGDIASCSYVSDRGARFVSADVDRPTAGGLNAAREACLGGVKPMKATGKGFVCIEQAASGDRVVGTTVARGRLWMVLILPTSGGTHHPELAAMLALMNAVPTGT